MTNFMNKQCKNNYFPQMIMMLQDTELSFAGINFIVPQNFYVASSSRKDAEQNGLTFVSPENDCFIDVFTIESNMTDNVREKFLEQFENTNIFTVHGKFEESIRAYLYSIRAEYESRDTGYFEICFGQRKGFNERVLLLVTADKNRADIGKIMKRQNMQKLIDSFEVAE